MMNLPMTAAVSATRYPGRGILIGKRADGKKALMAYFIMGRSENSRNRVFVEDGDGLKTQALNPSKMVDPSLIIYAPVRVLGGATIITNGDQTDTIYDHLTRGGTFESALRTRAFEPDAPNFTPRISALVTLKDGDFSLKLSILKASDALGTASTRIFFEYDTVAPGTGYFLHTYAGDGDPLPPFAGEPEPVTMDGDLDGVTDALWHALDPENKVSLWVREVDLETGVQETRIVNRNA